MKLRYCLLRTDRHFVGRGGGSPDICRLSIRDTAIQDLSPALSASAHKLRTILVPLCSKDLTLKLIGRVQRKPRVEDQGFRFSFLGTIISVSYRGAGNGLLRARFHL